MIYRIDRKKFYSIDEATQYIIDNLEEYQLEDEFCDDFNIVYGDEIHIGDFCFEASAILLEMRPRAYDEYYDDFVVGHVESCLEDREKDICGFKVSYIDD